MSSRPHTESIYNKLELFNESMLTLICYMMIPYSGVGSVDLVIEAQAPIIIVLAITVCIVIANFYVMLRLTFVKLMRKYKVSKQKKLKLTLEKE